ncbi:hypothetical protein [Tautonia rosea]|uniref:hypothetical protein n=1 Tax=Tautonia rosea TaxID=2728037 RepID=UPI0014752B3C|nr:hypothetical protein [Tautonia rosea]
MTICVVTRSLAPSIPAVAMAQTLAAMGHRVVVLLAPADHSRELPSEQTIESRGMEIHRLATPRWLRRVGGRRGRRLAIAQALRRLEPQVVHLTDEGDRGVAVPPGSVVIQSTSRAEPLRGADATVTPDGRFFDRSGRLMECPGVPPMPKSLAVADGLDPEVSASQWRVLTYLAGVDQLRRSRRVRLDGPHAGASSRSIPFPGRSTGRPTPMGAMGTI